MRTIVTIHILLTASTVFAQEDSIKSVLQVALREKMREIRETGNNTFDLDYSQLMSNNPEVAFTILRDYEDDPLHKIQEEVVKKYKSLKSKSTNTEFRQLLTHRLLLFYQKSKIQSSSYNTFFIPKALADPEKSKFTDFNALSKAILKDLLQDTLISKHIFKVVGIAGMEGQLSVLQKFLPDEELYRPEKPWFYFLSREWYARLAMARLGDKAQINFCVQKIESSEELILSNPYRIGDYFDDIVYINKPQVLPFLFYMLLKNQEFEGKPGHSSSGPAIHALKRLLVGFPPETEFSLTEQGERYYRKWIRQNRGKYEFKVQE